LVLAAALLLPGAFAASPARKSLRVMTYNIHVGIGMDKKLDLARIASVINNERPDLVALQEVDRGVERTQRVDQIKELALLTKLDFAFANNLEYQGGHYGVAVLSRFPILAIDHRRFQHMREAERRGFVRIEVKTQGRTIHFVTTHLDYQHADNRLFEARQLLKALSDMQGPLIIAGDFNDEPSGETYKFMTASFVDAWTASTTGATGDGLTYPADKPLKRIDFIFLRNGVGLKAHRAQVMPTLSSDHLPLVADIEFD
jgi:endonuclease/exonuclease/phosphatase family metal-dependent hydrolase